MAESMNKNTLYRRVRLSDYMVEQRIGPDADAQARLLCRISTGEIEAFYVQEHPSLPSGASTSAVLRHAIRTPAGSHERPALSHIRVATEIKKAALGREADWALLDRLILCVRGDVKGSAMGPDCPAPSVIVAPARKRRSVFDDRAQVILKVIDSLADIDPMAIKLPTKPGGRDGDRNRIFCATPEDCMGTEAVGRAVVFEKAFENTWGYMLKRGLIRIVKRSSL